MSSRGGCSGCGLRTTVILTDSRLIVREKDTNCCGCGGVTIDTTAFLQDIDMLSTSKQSVSIAKIIAGILTGKILCLLCDICCGPKMLGIRGAFGSHAIAFESDEIAEAAAHITSAIRNAKSKITPQPSTIGQL
ncbi:unnamed protein product [Rotaria sp. Silwood1]|nr:unnamed protein product [Rotaria sp. Silwood1]CAF1643932.1 unnamed protein product [Rotaria sp. Silwood1]CAF3827934.1 unnamed protein product [Rotaria sp. Silwood1]CAF4859929.1 unnamed protein product [Rotaria sp. Silwood1]